MLKIKGLDHVVIRAHDAEALTQFYCDVLGCTLEREVEEYAIRQLRAGNALIDIVAVDGKLGRAGGAGPGKEGRNMDHFCLRLEDFDEAAIRDHLAKFNVSGSETGRRYGADGFGPSIYIQDPEGNTVELKGGPTEA